MTHHEWAVERAPLAPKAIMRRLGTLFESHPEWSALGRADAFQQATEELARRVLAADGTKRANALDLLSADACVTFAFEAAADEPATLVDRARTLQQRIAALVPVPVVPGPRTSGEVH